MCSARSAQNKNFITCASGSAVEHLLAKEGVAGSIPVSRSEDSLVRILFCYRNQKQLIMNRTKRLTSKLKDAIISIFQTADIIY